MTRWFSIVLGAAIAGLLGCQALADPVSREDDARQIKRPDAPVPVAAPVAEVITLPGGAQDDEQWEQFLNQLVVRNVSVPGLYPVRPSPEKNNGKAVIIVPGGGYAFVSVENEGFPVANRLAEEGYTAFVLKYRTRETPRSPDEFLDAMIKQFTGIGRRELEPYQPAIDDLIAAMHFVSGNCPKFDCAPGPVGLIGFSAGGMSVLKALQNVPDDVAVEHAALIYPPMTQSVDFELAMPVFLAIAIDDPLFEQGGFSFPGALSDKARSFEFHLYSGGGHGFGTLKKGTTSAAWLEQYVLWLGVAAPDPS